MGTSRSFFFPCARVAMMAAVLSVAACGGEDDAPAGAPGGSTPGTGGSAEAGGSNPGSGGSTGTGGAPTGGGQLYGEPHMGQYQLGPVEWHGDINNSCSPYTPALEAAEGDLLAGVTTELFDGGHLCDACIRIDTAMGKSIVARVVTNGTEQEVGDIDVSPAVFGAINVDEFPRTMTWQLVKCPDTGNIYYQFQTQAHEDWSSLWVRNQRVAVKKLEVKSARHADWFALSLANDGTYTDAGGFGLGPFTLQVTSYDDQVVTDTFPGFQAGDVLESGAQFQ